MKRTNRIIALALCCALTLGAFAYRPPTAKAIAVVDDAVVIGALLTAFSAGCGLIFSNNGMTSSEIASAMTTKWNEYKETLSDTVSSFSAWLGYDDMDALITDLRWDQVKESLAIPRAVARKFSDFVTWLKNDIGITPGSSSVIYSNSWLPLSLAPRATWDGVYSVAVSGNSFSAAWGNIANPAPYVSWTSAYFSRPSNGTVIEITYDIDVTSGSVPDTFTCMAYRGTGGTTGTAIFTINLRDGLSGTETVTLNINDSTYPIETYPFLALNLHARQNSKGSAVVSVRKIGYDASFSTTQAPDAAIPDLADEAANPTLSGVGDGTATTIEELLQKILEQVQANTLAPTLDVAGTETGGDTDTDTDTDEDSKPYLPYIPRIFSKLETLPQDIADKVKGLFVPDEALLTEITDTFKGKFGFLPVLKQFADDLFGMTPETDPPVIWIHLENAESKYGYNYGGKTKALDLTWYQKYKANVDTIVSGFLWLAFLWLLFKRASSIIQGGEMVEQYSADISAGHREKGGKRK